MSTVIKVENISKVYQLGQFSTGTLSADLSRWWALKRGKEDPYLKIGEVNDRAQKGDSNIVWSLRDINFEVEQGNAVGIVGKNGAGKSTLLKILSQITSPSTGSVKVKGRIASLLEVGTGFHPELSGRENIFLNGAILGMRKHEIARKFDEIVEFAGVERYIDTPVKRYSSGMYVRLAFSVAAFLESEILILDEVLAVGDYAFQEKCINTLNTSLKNQRTILFVSHNLSAVNKLCKDCILIDKGQLISYQSTREILKQYIALDNTAEVKKIELTHSELRKNSLDNSLFKFTTFEILKESTDLTNEIMLFEKVRFKISGILYKKMSSQIKIGIAITSKSGVVIFHDFGLFVPQLGKNEIIMEINNTYLAPDVYDVGIGANGIGVVDWFPKVMTLKVKDIDSAGLSSLDSNFSGLVLTNIDWKFNN